LSPGRLIPMNARKQKTDAVRARQEIDAPEAWKEYRAARARRLENMIRLRAERLRREADKYEATRA
jgi:hypothetical protein